MCLKAFGRTDLRLLHEIGQIQLTDSSLAAVWLNCTTAQTPTEVVNSHLELYC
jgi:hypothetical protein